VRRWRATVGVLTVAACLCAATPASASAWTVPASASSSGEAHAGALGIPSPSASCVTPIGTTIQVSWTALAQATGYSVGESTTSATTGYTLLASTTATSVTTGGLALANYWFEVTATAHKWSGLPSTATGETTITLAVCTQP